MGLRRITSGAGNNTPEHPEEIVNGRTHVEQKRFLFFVCVLSNSVALMFPRWASAQDTSECLPHCLKKFVAGFTPYELIFDHGVYMETLIEEQDCKDACFNNERCTGAVWGLHLDWNINTCWFLTDLFTGNESLRNGDAWTLKNCSDDCLPYCWKPKLVNVHAPDGFFQAEIKFESKCKLLCNKDQSCKGVDFNTADNTCYFLTNLTRTPTELPVHHWEIKRNLPTICEKEPLTTSPNETASVPAGEPMTSPAATEAPGETTSVVPPAVTPAPTPAVPPANPPSVPTDSPTAPTTAVSLGLLPTVTPERTTATVPPTLPQTVSLDVTPAVTPEETTSVVPPVVPPDVPPVFPPAPTTAFSLAVSPAVTPAVPPDFPPGPTPDVSPAVLPSSGTLIEANTTPLSGLRAGESPHGYGYASVARGGSAIGESNIGNGSAPAVGVPTGAFTKGIVVLAVVMGVLVLVIIGVTAYKIWNRFGKAKTDSRLPLRNDNNNKRGYQSTGTIPDTAGSSKAKAAYKAT